MKESAEMYLETILTLSKKQEYVRAIDICEEMGYSKPSVSRAVGLLRSGGYIYLDDASHIFLTDEGRKIAEKIYERHTLICDLLVRIGVSEKTAASDACRIEHAISPESFEAIKRYVESIK